MLTIGRGRRAGGSGLAGAGRGRRVLPLVAAAAALALTGCHADRNVSAAYSCSRDHEYQAPRTPACPGHRSHPG